MGAAAIVSQGVSLAAAREAAAVTLPPAAGAVPELIPYDTAAQQVLQLTFGEALRLGHNYVGTEHILLALLEQENGSGVLTGLGLTKGSTDEMVAAALTAIVETQQQA